MFSCFFVTNQRKLVQMVRSHILTLPQDIEYVPWLLNLTARTGPSWADSVMTSLHGKCSSGDAYSDGASGPIGLITFRIQTIAYEIWASKVYYLEYCVKDWLANLRFVGFSWCLSGARHRATLNKNLGKTCIARLTSKLHPAWSIFLSVYKIWDARESVYPQTATVSCVSSVSDWGGSFCSSPFTIWK